jgi:ABC-type glycerol-3-phosphate transport system permease component
MSFWRRDYFLPAVLIVLGVYFLLRNTGWLDWLGGEIIWPVLLIGLGVWLIFRRARV